jgi:predicted chitinase
MLNSTCRLALSIALRLGLAGFTTTSVLFSVSPPSIAPTAQAAAASAVTDQRPTGTALHRAPALSRGADRERGHRRTHAVKHDRPARAHARRAPRRAIELDARTLSRAMGGTVSLARYKQLLPAFNNALAAGHLNTVRRVATFCAQVGHESVGLKYMEEIASGSAYNGRVDLGNTHPGDGERFKGRGPIQITGRANYRKVSEWAHGRGTVPTRDYFIDHPARLASDRHGFDGVVWYWTRARNMNAYADRADIIGATRAVNGGTNGLDDRIARWRHCLKMGDDLLGNRRR